MVSVHGHRVSHAVSQLEHHADVIASLGVDVAELESAARRAVLDWVRIIGPKV